MNNRNTILIELEELGSSLANQDIQSTYQVPQGYFDGLANEVIARIRALELSDSKDEIKTLSPILAELQGSNPFTVPQGYFDILEETFMDGIRAHADHQSPSEELESISPFLNSLPKKTPYTVPAGYFESISGKPDYAKATSGKVIGISRKWFRYAAAAIITGVVVGSALFFLLKSQPDPNKNPQAWIKKNVEKKVDDAKLDEFLALATGGENNEPVSNPNTVSNEVKELMKDVPESEIQSFLRETAGITGSDETDVLLN